jgi:LmbE family N-acetylglucosaminyl deacetylase
MNILAIGAHPDDVEFGCTGTLRKHVLDGDSVHILIMTLSDLELYDGTIKHFKEIRKQESIKAAQIIGATIEFLNYEDTKVPFNHDSVANIEKVIHSENIDIIYTHWTDDTHQDHINTINSTLAAARYVNNVLCYEQVPLPRVGMNYPKVNYYVNIDSTMETKINACKCHKSEIEKFNNYGYDIIDSVKTLAKYRANQIGCEHAEAFSILKMIKQ